MTTSRYLTLYEFNWLPAMYAHITHFGDWTRHLVDKDIAQIGSSIGYRAKLSRLDAMLSSL